MAYSAAAGFNVGGVTLHLGLHIGRNTRGINASRGRNDDDGADVEEEDRAPTSAYLTGNTVKNMRREYQDCKIVIIDEDSLVGCEMNHVIYCRPCQACDKLNEYDGGVNTVFFGDFY